MGDSNCLGCGYSEGPVGASIPVETRLDGIRGECGRHAESCSCNAGVASIVASNRRRVTVETPERWLTIGDIRALVAETDAVPDDAEIRAGSGLPLDEISVEYEPMHRTRPIDHGIVLGSASGALTSRQLDGFACVVCDTEPGRMVPAGFGPRGQLFECASHTEGRAGR